MNEDVEKNIEKKDKDEIIFRLQCKMVYRFS